MDILKNHELGKVLGGGYWWQAPNGQWIYDSLPRQLTWYKLLIVKNGYYENFNKYIGIILLCTFIAS